MDEYEKLTDEFRGAKICWVASKTVSPSWPMGYYPEQEKRYYRLTFHQRYREMITGAYLEHVVKEGKEISVENKWHHRNCDFALSDSRLPQQLMKAILRKDGCLAAINERPVDFADDIKWNEMDENDMTNFHLALVDEVLLSIEEKKTAKEICDHLTKLYEATSLHNKIFLKRKLYTLRMPESTSVTEHLNTLNTLFSQLTSLSCKIGEQEHAELLLQSLPDSYDQLIINLTNNNVTSLVFDDVAAAVLQEENRRKNKEDRRVNLQQAEALTTMTTMRGRSTERGQSSSHKYGISKSRSKKNLKCYNCGKNGHLKKDCWSLNKNSNPQGNTANTSDDGDALCCEASTTVEGRKRFADIWLIDSGATYHMTSRKEWFHHYEPVSGGFVYSCNDHALEIIGVGTIKLKMYDGTIKVVRDVRHVKGLKKNLLSYGLLDNNASKIETRKGIMKVFRGALVVLKGEKITANLYMLKGETLLEAEASVASCSSDSAMLWHQKLGHMSEQGMKVLVEQKLLPGLTKVSLILCEHCITSKQYRLKFNTSNSRGKSVLELVHSDVWQAPVTSLGGAKYFVSFIDDYSRRCWVYPIKKKSDVFSTFKNFKARVELDYGNKADEQNLVRKNKSNVEGCMPRKIILGRSSQYRLLFGELSSINCNRAEDTNGDVDWKCKFLGYADGVKGYRLWDHTARKVIISRDVIFVEDKLQRKEDDDSAEKSETTQIHVEKEFKQGDSSEAEPAHDEQEPESSEAPTTQDGEPSTYQETINNSDASLWMMAMQEEIEALHKNNAWDLVPLPQGRKPIGNKWVFKIKRNDDDQVERYRARLLDVKIAFLHGNLEEEIYMLQPEGFEEEEKKNLVCRLNADPCAYFKRSGDNDFVILLLYVDDMLVAGPNKDNIEELKAQLAREFEMKDLGSANKILGMQIHRDRSNRKIWLSQKNYLKKILSRFNMQDCKPISTPLPINFKLSSSMSPSSEEERMEMYRVPSASAVGSLMFAMICTRPDIAQAVGVVSRYMANPGKEHWNTVKRILRYIKGTSNVALCYRRSNLLINGYVDSDYAGDLDKSKSTTGYVFKVAGGAVSWVSKLQSVVATSTIEAEYVAATQASKEAIWLKMLLEELGHNQEYVSLFCDSQSALHLARNPTFYSRTKHIRVQYHFIREKVEEGTVDMQKIHTKDNIADFMTKAINADKFTWFAILLYPIVVFRNNQGSEPTEEALHQQPCYKWPSYKQTMWSHIVFEHPATFDTMALEPSKKKEIIEDLVTFSQSKEFYSRIGKAWKRGYLLYGPPGTGKSTMIAAMAYLLKYDVYDLELTAVKDNTELRKLLIETTSKSIIVIEDIDCSLDLTGQRKKKGSKAMADEEKEKVEKERREAKEESNNGGGGSSRVTLLGLLNFIDGLWSACGGERLIVFTTNYVEKLDPALIRRGRMDKHIELSYCSFEGFKVLAKNYLKLETHPLFDTIDGLIKEVDITPTDVAETLMPKSPFDNAEKCLWRLIHTLEESKEEAGRGAGRNELQIEDHGTAMEDDVQHHKNNVSEKP
ncbi:putative tRNA ligase [Hibiscus syriacus]|uniref:tRNA ligase n=1 Tax=Hibiscus syriacus TaxID=106335 RepID=A0A6A3A1X8_HIBSY|nr:putative tRNA ligase [Hibiscus syriacus]